MIERLLGEIQLFAKNEPAVLAVDLIGSHARGTAREDSDVDLVFIAG